MKMSTKKHLINLLLIFFILILLGSYIYYNTSYKTSYKTSYQTSSNTSSNQTNKNKINFEFKELFFDSTIPSFLGLSNNKLYFIQLDDNRKVTSIIPIKSPKDDSSQIKSFIYSNRNLFLLTNTKLYVWYNCNLHEENKDNKNYFEATKLSNPERYIKICFDSLNNKIFLLGSDKKIYSYDYSKNNETTVKLFTLNLNESTVVDFDISNNYLVYVSTKSQTPSNIYIYNMRNNLWTTIFNPNINNITNIILNQNGLGVKGDGGWYYSIGSEDQYTNFEKRDNADSMSAFSSNMDIISIIKNNKINMCDSPCKDNLMELSTPGYSFSLAKPIYYIYPSNEQIGGPIDDISTGKKYDLTGVKEIASSISTTLNTINSNANQIPIKFANFKANENAFQNNLFTSTDEILNKSKCIKTDSNYIQEIVQKAVLDGTYFEDINTPAPVSKIPILPNFDNFENVPKPTLYLINKELEKVNLMKASNSRAPMDIIIQSKY